MTAEGRRGDEALFWWVTPCEEG